MAQGVAQEGAFLRVKDVGGQVVVDLLVALLDHLLLVLLQQQQVAQERPLPHLLEDVGLILLVSVEVAERGQDDSHHRLRRKPRQQILEERLAVLVDLGVARAGAEDDLGRHLALQLNKLGGQLVGASRLRVAANHLRVALVQGNAPRRTSFFKELSIRPATDRVNGQRRRVRVASSVAGPLRPLRAPARVAARHDDG